MAGCIPISLPGGREGRQLAIFQDSAVPTGGHLDFLAGESTLPAKNAAFSLFSNPDKKK
jgi:hypothetical protein